MPNRDVWSADRESGGSMREVKSNLRLFPGITVKDHEPNVMLDLAKEGALQSVVILGHDNDGEFFFSSNKADGGEVLWLLEMAKKQLLEIAEPGTRDETGAG
jgi:hypothetical protein